MKAWHLGAAATILLTGCSGAVVETKPLPSVAHVLRVLGSYSLPRAYVPVRVVSKKNCELTVTIEEPSIHPDRQRYEVVYNHRITYDDTFSVQTEDGLLVGINTTSESKSEAIIESSIGVFGDFAKLVAAAKAQFTEDPKPDPPSQDTVTCRIIDITILVDPFHADATAKFQKVLDDIKANIEVELSLTPPGGTSIENAPLYLAPVCLDLADVGEIVRSGVCYRPIVARRVVVRAKQGKDLFSPWQAIVDKIVSVPDPRQVFYVPLDRKLFAKFDVELTFDRGVLTKFKSTDPSEVLAALAIPSTVVKSLLGLGK